MVSKPANVPLNAPPPQQGVQYIHSSRWVDLVLLCCGVVASFVLCAVRVVLASFACWVRFVVWRGVRSWDSEKWNFDGNSLRAVIHLNSENKPPDKQGARYLRDGSKGRSWVDLNTGRC